MSNRMSIPEIAARLSVGRVAVYTMLDRGVIPAIRIGRRWIITQGSTTAGEPLTKIGGAACLSNNL